MASGRSPRRVTKRVKVAMKLLKVMQDIMHIMMVKVMQTMSLDVLIIMMTRLVMNSVKDGDDDDEGR